MRWTMFVFICFVSLATSAQGDSFQMDSFKRAEKARKWRFRQKKSMFQTKKTKLKVKRSKPDFYFRQKKKLNFGWR